MDTVVHSLILLRAFMLAFFATTQLAACNAMSDLQAISKKAASHNNSSSSETNNSPNDKESEGDGDTSIVPPTPVGGSYLVCAVESAAPAKDQMNGLGCRLEVNYKKVTLKAGAEPKFTFSVPMQSSYIVSPISQWHWIVYVAQSVDASKVDIQVEVETTEGLTVSVPKPLDDASAGLINTSFSMASYASIGAPNDSLIYENTSALEIKLPMIGKPKLETAGSLSLDDLIGMTTELEITQDGKVTRCKYEFQEPAQAFVFHSCS